MATGFKYKNKTDLGSIHLSLKEGLELGKTKIAVKGSGALADVPGLPLAVAPYRVQLKIAMACAGKLYTQAVGRTTPGASRHAHSDLLDIRACTTKSGRGIDHRTLNKIVHLLLQLVDIEVNHVDLA